LRAVLLSFMLCAHLSTAQALVTLKFGVVPQQSPTRLMSTWTPLLQRLSMACSCRIEFVTAPDTTVFETSVKNAEYDLAYMNPMHFVRTGKAAGYEAIAREGKRRLRGILVVRHDSPVTQLDQLNHQKIAMPGPTSFAATILVQDLFAQKHMTIEPAYVNSHESVYMNVIAGLFPAGGAINRTFDALPAADKSKLRILATTRDVTSHPIAILKKINPKLKSALQRALTQLQDSEEGRKILANLEFFPLVTAKDSDWADVEKIVLSMRGLL